MCIIIAKPEGVPFPSLDTLKICNTNNDDGCGLAYHKKGGDKVHVKKDFIAVEDMWDYITQNLTDEDSAIIHFRLATSGLVDFGNRHPFPISGIDEQLRSPDIYTDMAIAHNGVFSRWNNRDGDLSDTQHFIKNVLSDSLIRANLKSNLAIQTLISDFIGGSKLAILDNTGHLSCWGHFVKDNGLHYSNTSYQHARITYSNWQDAESWREYHQTQLGEDGDDSDPCYEMNIAIGGLCESCAEKQSETVAQVDDEYWVVCVDCKEQIDAAYEKCSCGRYTDYQDGRCLKCQEQEVDFTVD